MAQDDLDNMLTTVVRYLACGFPDGTAVIALETLELGVVAFRVDQKAIEVLRLQLDTAEAFLRQARGEA